MSISIQARTDYSSLFSSLNSSNSSSSAISDMSWLTDYSSIKSGTYGKLMKAYYASASDDEDSTSSVLSKLTKTEDLSVSDETKAYTKTATSADALMTSISDIGSLEDDATDDEVYNAVSDYVKNYNSLLTTAADTSDTSISNRLTSIRTATASNETALNKLGISIGSDGALSINKDTFAAADKSSVQTLFSSKGSYGSSVNVSAAMIKSTANYDAAKTSTYTATGSYSSVVGSLWDSTT
ncbi:MAG: hypothetical protein K6G12_07845 [Lachnospiraceae bacterium]|nr:hypothetical protein [Lachnospiraceae bacterium]